MSQKDAYVQKLKARLDEWSGEIDSLKVKADEASADAKIEYYEQIEELHNRQEDVRNKLEELEKAGDDAWEDLKAGAESAWDALNQAVSSAMSRFK